MKGNSFLGRICLVILVLSLQGRMFGQTSNERLQSITAALRGRDFQQALQSLQSALQESPNNPQLWMRTCGLRTCVEDFAGLSACFGRRGPIAI